MSEDPKTSALQDLATFLDQRTVGISGWSLPTHGVFHVFYWRGQGYDDGWGDLTLEEVATYLDLMSKVIACR